MSAADDSVEAPIWRQSAAVGGWMSNVVDDQKRSLAHEQSRAENGLARMQRWQRTHGLAEMIWKRSGRCCSDDKAT